MTKEEARRRLDQLNAAISTAVMLIRAERDTLDRFFVEQQSMDSIGPILDPTLFNSTERRTTEAILTPIYKAARHLADAYDLQLAASRSALAKVKGEGNG